MGSQALSGNMTTTIIITVLALATTVSHSHPFFLRDNYETGASSRASNQTEDDSVGLTQDTILGVFDTVTGLTYGLGGLFQQFEEGFEQIRPGSDTTVTNIDSGLKNVGEGFHDWRQENFGIKLRRKKVTEAETGEDGEDGEEAAEEV